MMNKTKRTPAKRLKSGELGHPKLTQNSPARTSAMKVKPGQLNRSKLTENKPRQMYDSGPVKIPNSPAPAKTQSMQRPNYRKMGQNFRNRWKNRMANAGASMKPDRFRLFDRGNRRNWGRRNKG